MDSSREINQKKQLLEEGEKLDNFVQVDKNNKAKRELFRSQYLTQQVQQGEVQFFVFLFANPGSGGQVGQSLAGYGENGKVYKIDLVQESVQSGGQKQFICTVFIGNLIDKGSKEEKLNMINWIQEEENLKKSGKILVIACGGDGTIMFVLEELMKQKNINFENLSLGVLPLGTGNDFSRALGWGGAYDEDLMRNDGRNLKKCLSRWIQAEQRDFDLWEVEFRVDAQQGCFRKVEKNEQGENVVRIVQDQEGKEKKVFHRLMSNYLGLGTDARVGLNFDKNRSKSRCFNKCVYCWQGFKKLFQKNPRIPSTVDRLEIQFEENLPEDNQIEISLQQENKKQEIVLSNQNEIKGKPEILLILNIQSYAAGMYQIWDSTEKNALQNKQQNNYLTQNFGDGKLEMVTLNGIGQLAIERLFPGRSARIAQGKGPFVLNFQPKHQKGHVIETYFHVDGEYFYVKAPEKLTISQTKQIPNGKIKVIVNTKNCLQRN